MDLFPHLTRLELVHSLKQSNSNVSTSHYECYMTFYTSTHESLAKLISVVSQKSGDPAVQLLKQWIVLDENECVDMKQSIIKFRKHKQMFSDQILNHGTRKLLHEIALVVDEICFTKQIDMYGRFWFQVGAQLDWLSFLCDMGALGSSVLDHDEDLKGIERCLAFPRFSQIHAIHVTLTKCDVYDFIREQYSNLLQIRIINKDTSSPPAKDTSLTHTSPRQSCANKLIGFTMIHNKELWIVVHSTHSKCGKTWKRVSDVQKEEKEEAEKKYGVSVSIVNNADLTKYVSELAENEYDDTPTGWSQQAESNEPTSSLPIPDDYK